MAPLTWRNVNAPDFASSARILGNAGRGLGDGLDSISGVFKDARARQINTRSNEGIGQLAGATTESEVDRIMAQVLQGTAARDRNGALNEAIMGSNGRALGLDNDRADLRNTASQISNRNARTGMARTAADEARTQRELRAANALEVARVGGGTVRASTDDSFTRLGLDTPVVEPTSTPVVEYPVNPGSGDVAPPAGMLMRTPPVQPAAGTIPTYGGADDDKVLLDGKLTGNDDKDSPVDRALQAFENGEPMTQEIMNTIQGAYDGTDQDAPFTPPNRSPNEGIVNQPDVGLGLGTGMGMPIGINGDISQGSSFDINLPGQRNPVNRGQRQDQILASVGQQPLPGSNANGTGFAPNGGIAGAFQNSAGPVTPSGSQVPDLTTITTPDQQAEIDQVIDEGTDDATGEPVSTEARNLMNTTVYDMIKDSGVDYSMEEVQSMMEWRQGQLAGMKTEEDANFQKQVDAEVFENVRNLGANGLQEITDRVNNHPDLSPREREAYLASIGKLPEDFFSPSEGGARLLAAGEGSPQAQLAADMTATQDALDSFGMFSTGATALGGGTSADGGESTVSPENLNALVSTEVASAGQNPQGDDRLQTGPTMDIVQKLWQETGLDLGIIQSEIGNSTVSDDRWGRSNGVKVDEDLLRARLNRYIDDGGANPDGLAARQSAERLNQSQITELGLIQSQLDSNNADFSVLSRRQQTPEVQAAIAKLRTSQQDLAAQATALRGTVGSVSSNRPKTPEPAPAPEPAAGGADTRFQVPNDATTPEGNAYEDNASEFGRFVNANRRNGEVGGAIVEITNRLRSEGGGGDFGIRSAFGEMTDAFRPRDVSDRNSENRDSATAARDWYKSAAGQELLFSNPMLIVEAQEDPIAFYRKHSTNR
jgi:hypothetical protein